MQSAAGELLSDLAPVLGRWGSWYLFAAQAGLLYGVARLGAEPTTNDQRPTTNDQ